MAQTNTWNNEVRLTKAALKYIENNSVFLKHVNRQYDDQFRTDGAKGGDTANIRVPGFGTYRTGKVAQPTGNNETYVPVVLQQGGSDFEVSSKELALNVDEMMTILGPRLAVVVNQIDYLGLQTAITGVANAVGTPGTAPTSLKPFTDAYAKMAKFGMPPDENVSAIVDYNTQSALVDGLGSRLNPPKEISDQYRTGNMGIAGGMKFSADQEVPILTLGSMGAATPTLNATSNDGDTTINVTGLASGATSLVAGTTIQIGGVYAVNAVTKASTGVLKDFVVTTTTSDSSGSISALPIFPTIHLTGPLQNVSATPTSGAKIYIFGNNQESTYNQMVSPLNLVFHRDAFVLATADLAPVPGSIRMRSPKLDFALRYSKYWNGQTDDFLHRIDVLFGWAVLRPEFACKVMG